MVLVDTSIWIDFFHTSVSREGDILANWISEEKDLAICGVIRQEILQGIRDDVTLKRVQALIDQTHYFPLDEPRTFDHAARIYRDLRHRGLTLRSPNDCLIAAVAIESKVPLFHKDRDFLTIAKVAPLMLAMA